METVVDAQDLSLAFGATKALDGLTLSASAGAVTALLGPNGAGKTTFIRCCTALERPHSGSLTLFGQSPGSPDVLSRIGLMPQATGAWSGIRAEELLRYLSRLYADPQPVEALVDLLGIAPFARTPYRRLSGGQQQAVNLAGALIGRPSLVFLDEPSAGLDPRARRLTWDVVRRVRDAGVAVVLTTHDMVEAAELADHVHIVDRGRVQVSGSVSDLASHGSLEDAFLTHTSGDR
ncbi:ABC transporter ATP-binding protein [Tessaracoccus flavus]|uniref:ABC transporter ATP-binding protein n=1 Tax=Tessaracoccus flavus TaxID=1610493 RepID=A0A1Q2CDL0_9ACTN|nr:ABC transporter ATP-binding protein [Tessaracoccus flavus]AQP44135.1 ABC transporter ATP-binding protein [Tessaracoccus flavus]SDY36175.1 ABC-2 type transport system ATP-binding protein [Tessaracoccus flavus]